ncbi:WYL domain-containing protein [Wukongibacter baidiensis]|uniref:helix-turn-helix transcriptional regulator n=1 Tax=Wukongibacter baidiensis TaxID=1723361 RepID=UPI003D7FB499
MRADRLLSIISLLQLHKQITAKELADILEVSIRTIYRDIDALTTMGVPVITDRGHDGGIKLLGDYKTDLTGLNDEELQYLFLPPPQKVLTDLDIKDLNYHSLLKLIGSASKHQLDLIENIQNYIYIDMYSWNETNYTNKEILYKLQKAIWNASQIAINYAKATGEKKVNLKPLGLVNKKGIWYLAAIDDVVKIYKVSSITNVLISDLQFERPHNFNLEEYWKKSTSDFMKKIPKYRIRIEAASGVSRYIESRKFISIIDKHSKEDTTLLTIEFNAKWEAVEFVLGYGDKIQIIEPEEVKTEVIEIARQLIDKYGAKP